MIRRLRTVAVMLACAALPAASAHAANQTVTAGASFTHFPPSAVTVFQGETVTWNNVSGVHNVHFDDNSFDQPPSAQSAPWTVSRTFASPGTFAYYCELHGGPGGVGMSGAVTVTPATGYARPKGATPVLSSLVVAYK